MNSLAPDCVKDFLEDKLKKLISQINRDRYY